MFSGESGNDQDSDNEDYDALFVDSDAENIATFSEDEEDEESEIEEPEPKKSKKPELPKLKKNKKQKKSVFAAASDYEDALQD